MRRLSRMPLLSSRIQHGIKDEPAKTIEYFLGESEETAEQQRNKELEEKRYKDESLAMLRKIESNTGDISQIISILQTAKSDQEKILSVLTEIQRIGISKSEEEADSKYKEVMAKINQLQEDAETIGKLTEYGKSAWFLVKAFIKTQYFGDGE